MIFANWLAVMGPDRAALGERGKGKPVVQAQIAATVVALLGRDYRKEVPGAAAPISEVLVGETKTGDIQAAGSKSASLRG